MSNQGYKESMPIFLLANMIKKILYLNADLTVTPPPSGHCPTSKTLGTCVAKAMVQFPITCLRNVLLIMRNNSHKFFIASRLMERKSFQGRRRSQKKKLGEVKSRTGDLELWQNNKELTQKSAQWRIYSPSLFESSYLNPEGALRLALNGPSQAIFFQGLGSTLYDFLQTFRCCQSLISTNLQMHHSYQFLSLHGISLVNVSIGFHISFYFNF